MTTWRAAGEDTATGDRVENEKAPAYDNEERVKKLESVVKRQRQVVRDQQTSITESILKSSQYNEFFFVNILGHLLVRICARP